MEECVFIRRNLIQKIKAHESGNIRKYGVSPALVSETDFRWLGRVLSQVSQEMKATGLCVKDKKFPQWGGVNLLSSFLFRNSAYFPFFSLSLLCIV